MRQWQRCLYRPQGNRGHGPTHGEMSYKGGLKPRSRRPCHLATVAELVDAPDLKSVDRQIVRVQVPLVAFATKQA